MYRDASHLWLSFSHNRTKINIQFLSILQKIEISVQKRSSGGVVVKLLACGARGPGFDTRSRRYVSEIGYLLLPSRDMAERSLKRHKSSKQPTNRVQKSKCFCCLKWNYQVRFIWKQTNIYIFIVCLKHKASVFQYVYTFQVFVLLEKIIYVFIINEIMSGLFIKKNKYKQQKKNVHVSLISLLIAQI